MLWLGVRCNLLKQEVERDGKRGQFKLRRSLTFMASRYATEVRHYGAVRPVDPPDGTSVTKPRQPAWWLHHLAVHIPVPLTEPVLLYVNRGL